MSRGSAAWRSLSRDPAARRAALVLIQIQTMTIAIFERSENLRKRGSMEVKGVGTMFTNAEIKNIEANVTNLVKHEADESFHDRKINSLLLSDSYHRNEFEQALQDYSCELLEAAKDDTCITDLYGLSKTFACNQCYGGCHWKRSRRVRGCGAFLQYQIDPAGLNEQGYQRLTRAYFCGDSLCSLCQWRRSRKVSNQLVAIMKHLGASYRYIFITLTIQNIIAAELQPTVHLLLREAWKKLINRKRFKDSIAGYYRTFEITHDTNEIITLAMYKRKRKFYNRHSLEVGDANPAYDTYHPHLHILAAVLPKYFDKGSSLYIDQKEWRAMWQQSLGVDYDPYVFVEVIYE